MIPLQPVFRPEFVPNFPKPVRNRAPKQRLFNQRTIPDNPSPRFVKSRIIPEETKNMISSRNIAPETFDYYDESTDDYYEPSDQKMIYMLFVYVFGVFVIFVALFFALKKLHDLQDLQDDEDAKNVDT